MKRILKTVALLLTLAALLSIFAGCFSSTPKIAYGKKYSLIGHTDWESSYVFNSDHTGYYETHHTDSSSSNSYVYSGRIYYVWRTGDGGNSIYLFKTKEEFDEGSERFSISDLPMSFGDDGEFLIRLYTNGTERFVLEGSDLEKALNED